MKSAIAERIVYTSPAEVAAAGAMALMTVARTGGAVALSGGSTPKAMYSIFRQQKGSTAEALRSLHYFFGDERSVPNDHPDSNVKLAKDGFMNALSIHPNNIHAVDGGAANLEEEAQRATADLKGSLMLNDEGTPVFDLVYLGMGEDGHTASLFPGTKGLAVTKACVLPNHVPQLDTWRLTLTCPVINAAKWVVILCTGAGKAKVLKEIFQRGDADPVYPIEHLNAARITWLLDEAAAAEL